MDFWSIFWPAFSALLSVTILMEAFHFLLGMWIVKRNQRAAEKQMAQLLASGVSPEMMGFPQGAGMPTMVVDPSAVAHGAHGGCGGSGSGGCGNGGCQCTASGTEDRGHGQYL